MNQINFHGELEFVCEILDDARGVCTRWIYYTLIVDLETLSYGYTERKKRNEDSEAGFETPRNPCRDIFNIGVRRDQRTFYSSIHTYRYIHTYNSPGWARMGRYERE